MIKLKKILVFLGVCLMLIAPVLSFAVIDRDVPDQAFQAGKSLVPCGHDKNSEEEINNPCSFKDALTLINAVIKFLLFKLVAPIAAIMFFYAGFKLVTSGGSTEAKGTAKRVFTNTVLGLVVALAAWLIINAILSILGYDRSWIGF